MVRFSGPLVDAMRVRCTLPNASLLINGVDFASDPDFSGVVSRVLTPEEAAHFTAIPGYTLIRDPDPDQSAAVAAPSGEEPVAAKRVYTRRKPL